MAAGGDRQSDDRGAHHWRARLHGFTRSYVWNRAVATAVLLASPAILATIGSTATTILVDRDITALSQRRSEIERDMESLSGFTREFGFLELARGATALILVSNSADMQLRYLMDRAFRLKAKASYMRINALLDPADWKERLAAYDALIAEDKAEYSTIQRLQALENETMQRASARLVTFQQQSSELAQLIESKSRFKDLVVSAGNALMYALTIIIFFFRTRTRD